MGRIWESINASNQHMLTHVPNGQIASSPLCPEVPVQGRAKFQPELMSMFGKYLPYMNMWPISAKLKKNNSVSYEANQKWFGSFVQLSKRSFFYWRDKKKGEIWTLGFDCTKVAVFRIVAPYLILHLKQGTIRQLSKVSDRFPVKGIIFATFM